MRYLITSKMGEWGVETCCSDEEIIEIQYDMQSSAARGAPSPLTRKQLVNEFKKLVTKRNPAPWAAPGYDETVFDLSLLRGAFDELKDLDWLRGKISVEPEFESVNLDAARDALQQRTGFKAASFSDSWHASLTFTLLPELARKKFRLTHAPVEIHDSLQRFQLDYPDPAKAAFLIMRFRETRAHLEIYEAIGDCLGGYGIKALRADEKYYHDDLYHNILTYMHGCGFGVAVFERIEEELFNPNISLEVGYLLALQKPICILKDRTLKTLHADLMGKLYKVFDPLDAGATLASALSDWLRDKGLI